MKKYCFGVDVGGTTVKCGLFTVSGELLDKWEIPTRTENNGDQILPDICAALLNKIEEKHLAKEEVSGVGIGIPGPVGEDGTTPVAVNLHWGYKDIAGEVSALTGLKVKAGNDANVAALGEYWKGGGAGASSMVMVTLGTGVGGGIIIGGKILTGFHGAGGEIGHIHVDDTMQEACNCGSCGCLEQFTSATGIARLARAELAESTEDSLLRSAGSVSAKTVFDAVKQNDPLAIRIALKFGQYLGKGLSMISCVADPEVFVIGGGVSKAGDILLDYIREDYVKYAFSNAKKAKFTLATLGNDAGIYGSAKLVAEEI